MLQCNNSDDDDDDDDDGDGVLSQVWLYDPREIGRNSCCVSKRKFTDVFPMENERDQDPLTGKIDSIFYSYPYHTTLILKQETVYEVSSYYSRPGSTNGAGFVRKMAPWYNIWFDICDVEWWATLRCVYSAVSFRRNTLHNLLNNPRPPFCWIYSLSLCSVNM